uniref:hypothetical protein n=1 Tax=Candidatus Enterococcus willemsii TaxID=1857215 RepID=UPI00403FB135
MGLFLKEEDFISYVTTCYPDIDIEKGNTIISVNVIHMQPIMSFAYITEELVIAAKYQRQLQIFTDHIMFSEKQLDNIVYVSKGVNAQLLVYTYEKLPNESNLVLTFNVSTLSGNRWHKENLKKMKRLFENK